MIVLGPFLCVERSPLEFTAALGYLQGLIGIEINVVLNAYGQFFGAGFTGRLLRVETLPPDHAAIRLVLGGGHGVFLDPADIEASLSRGNGDEELLEFHATFGVTVTVEAISSEQRPAPGR